MTTDTTTASAKKVVIVTSAVNKDVELAGKIHEDGTYHVTPELMQALIEQRSSLRSLQSENQKLREENRRLENELS